MKFRYCYFLLLFLLFPALAQAQESNNFPKDYFRNPLNVPIILAGGFGECRPNHFHTGIDIKTQGKENLPVHAAADGYIARISISNTGYGNCLYIAHPNGYTTVYGHLNDFYPALQAWMIARQYVEQKWKIQLFPKPGQFPVKKGQVIAWSGTTGGSTGPHLHFEIRNTKTEHVLNELLFGLSVKDTRAPKAQAIAIYKGNESIYLQSPDIEHLVYLGHDQYKTKKALIKTGNPMVFLGIHAEDYMNGSHNWKGIYQMKLYLDQQLQVATLLQELNFALSRYSNAYFDYKTKKDKGIYYQGLYRLPNNKLTIYPFMNAANGKLDISDGKVHEVSIHLEDAAGNIAVVAFKIQYQPNGKTEAAHACKGQFWSCDEAHQYADSNFRFSAAAQSFYDDVCFQFQKESKKDAISQSVQVMNMAIPIQEACHLALKLNIVVPDSLWSKIALVHHVQPADLPGNNPQSGQAAHYQDGWARATVRTLGNYYAIIDTLAPTIKPYQLSGVFKSNQRIRFKVTDDVTSVASFIGTVNGQWLRFVRSGDIYTYKLDQHFPKGKNTLVIKALDENNNESVFALQVDYE